MAEQRVTQERPVTITSNTDAAAKITQERPVTITTNTSAAARITQIIIVTIDPVKITGDYFSMQTAS